MNELTKFYRTEQKHKQQITDEINRITTICNKCSNEFRSDCYICSYPEYENQLYNELSSIE